MIRLKSIEYKNILSVGNSPINVTLDEHKKTLVTGANGAGKSTFVEALCFALYGKPFRPIKKPQLVNAVNKKKLLTTVEFQDKKHTYKIVRGIKPNIFEVYKDGELIPQDAAVADYQEMVEKSILKMNISTFKQIAVLGTAGYTPFMLLGQAKRREIIEDLLDIQIFSVMGDLNKVQVKKLKEVIALTEADIEARMNEIRLHIQYQKENQDSKADDISKLEEELERHNTELQEALETLAQIDEDWAIADEELTELTDSLTKLLDEHKEKTKVALTELKAKITASQDEFDEAAKAELSTAGDTCEAELTEFEIESDQKISETYDSNAKQLKQYGEDTETNRPEAVKDGEIETLTETAVNNKVTLKTLNENKGFYDDNVTCPTCRQDIPEKFAQEFIELANKQIGELKEETAKILEQLKDFKERKTAYSEYDKERIAGEQTLKAELASGLSKVESDISVKRNALKSAHADQLRAIRDTQSSARQEINDKSRVEVNEFNVKQTQEADNIKASGKDRRDELTIQCESLKTARGLTDKTISSSKVNVQNTEANIERLKEKLLTEDRTELITELTDKLNEVKSNHQSNVDENHCRSVIGTLLKDSGVKTMIIQQYIPLINKYINEYLKLMGANYNFILDGEFNETIKSRGRDDFSYTSFSQGEKGRIDLALMFAFRDLVSARSGTSTSLLILDEVFDSAADTDGVEAINLILDNLDDNVIVISHNEKHTQSDFDRHIRFRKQGNFTKEA